nr:MAG TPA: hypothetical protein [Caudoviricetes sp.]
MAKYTDIDSSRGNHNHIRLLYHRSVISDELLQLFLFESFYKNKSCPCLTYRTFFHNQYNA